MARACGTGGSVGSARAESMPVSGGESGNGHTYGACGPVALLSPARRHSTLAVVGVGSRVGPNPDYRMTWKRLFRWLVRAALGGLALVLLYACLAWFLIRADEAERWARSYEGRIVTALGWQRSSDNSEQLDKHPELVLTLLENDSSRVRVAARFFLSRPRAPLGDATLDAIAGELGDPEGLDRDFLIKLLAVSGKGGVQRIITLYRKPDLVECTLQQSVCGAVEHSLGMPNDDLLAGLLEILGNENVLLGNRCLAADALGFIYKPNEAHERKDFRFAAMASLNDRLPALPEPVAASVRAALKRIEDEDTRRTKEGRLRYTREFQNLSDDGHEAIAALAEQDGCWRVAEAADALAKKGIKEAIPDLQRVAETHWYSPVRKSAARAIRVLQGQEAFRPIAGNGRGTWNSTLEMYREEEIERWRNDPSLRSSESYVPEISRKLRRTAYWRLLPKVKEVEFRRPGRLPRRKLFEDCSMRYMRPYFATSFAGGKLLGYAEGEFGAGTVFVRKGEIPQFFPTENVAGFVRMPFGVLILESNSACSWSGTDLTTQNADGTVSVQPFKALPYDPSHWSYLPSGDLFVDCGPDKVVITTGGHLRMATPEEIKKAD
jgi:hypothetical protein